MASSRFMGPLGSETNSPLIDTGTSALQASPLPGALGTSANSPFAKLILLPGFYYAPDIGWYYGTPPIFEMWPDGPRLGSMEDLLADMSEAGAELIAFLIKIYNQQLAASAAEVDGVLDMFTLYAFFSPSGELVAKNARRNYEDIAKVTKLLAPSGIGDNEKNVRKHFEFIGLKFLYLGPSNSMDPSGPGNILFGYYVAKLWHMKSFDLVTPRDFAETFGDVDQGFNPSSFGQFVDNLDDKLQIHLGLNLFRDELKRGAVIDADLIIREARHLDMHAFQHPNLMYQLKMLNPLRRFLLRPKQPQWYTPPMRRKH